ncbi:MAG: hypothetical protein H8E62_03505 [Planctomycetes bacterium]|nr:hypothetical protein [Planctomycetota bacterium]
MVLFMHWLGSDYLDRYARFYRAAGKPVEFYVEHGTIANDGTTQLLSTVLLSTTVADLEFKGTNGGIEMKLALNDGRESTTLLTTAILHNE